MTDATNQPNAAAAPRPNTPRVPTLCRLVCQAFEWFLADRTEEPRLPGMIPRTVIVPWWNVVSALCGADMEKFELRLKTIIGTGEFGDADILAEELQKAALKWTERALVELERPTCPLELKEPFLKDKFLMDDVREIARILPFSLPLKAQVSLAFSLLAEEEQMAGRRIMELSSDTVAMLKNQYLSFSDIVGPEARYFALALLNRMVRPWQMLLVARSVAWRPDEQGSRFPEFDSIALRLVLQQQVAARDIAALAGAQGDLAPILSKLYTLTQKYLDDADGLATSLGPAFATRTDASWNEILRVANGRLASVFDRAVLSRVAAVVLGARSIGDDDPNAEAQIEAAAAAAQLLALLRDRGAKYGMAGAARDCVATLAQAIQDQTQRLIAELQGQPDSHATPVTAMLRVTETLFTEGPEAQMSRNLRLARHSSAA